MNTHPAAPQGKPGSNLPWALTFVFWPLLGWTGDRPKHVAQNEPFLAHLGPWVSVVAHATGAILAALFVPLWGLTWLLFVALILTRRLAASAADPVRVHMRDLRYVLGSGPKWLSAKTATIALAATVALGVLATWLPDDLAAIASVGMIVVLLGLPILTTPGYVRAVREDHETMRVWADRFSTIFGVNESVIQEKAQIRVDDDGTVHMTTVPSKVADSYNSKSVDEMDKKIAGVEPDYMIDPNSHAKYIALIPVDEARLERRANPYVGERVDMEPVAYDQAVEPGTRPALNFDDLDLS